MCWEYVFVCVWVSITLNIVRTCNGRPKQCPHGPASIDDFLRNLSGREAKKISKIEKALVNASLFDSFAIRQSIGLLVLFL